MSRLLICMSLLASVLLAGCASQPGKPKLSDEELVAQRAAARWEALIASNPGEAYQYLSPGYREMVSRENYIVGQLQRPIRRTGAKVTRVECEAELPRCTVGLMLDYVVPSGMAPQAGKIAATTPVSEQWIKSGGKWYFVPKEISRR